MTPAGFPGADQLVKQFDRDGDGKLNAVEQMAAMSAYQSKTDSRRVVLNFRF